MGAGAEEQEGGVGPLAGAGKACVHDPAVCGGGIDGEACDGNAPVAGAEGARGAVAAGYDKGEGAVATMGEAARVDGAVDSVDGRGLASP